MPICYHGVDFEVGVAREQPDADPAEIEIDAARIAAIILTHGHTSATNAQRAAVEIVAYLTEALERTRRV